MLRRLTSLLSGRRTNEHRSEPPYAYAQRVCENAVHEFLWMTPQEIGLIIIIGGYEADEVQRMMKIFPRARFIIFEALPSTFARLSARFAGARQVTCVNLAASDRQGTAVFHELNMPGTGSLLQPGAAGVRDYGLQVREQVEVKTVTLDAYLAAEGMSDQPVDLLWCDVQGAELLVLEGASQTLSRTRSLFLEISIFEPIYDGAALWTDIHRHVGALGFAPVIVGAAASNGTGNALFVHPKRRGSTTPAH